MNRTAAIFGATGLVGSNLLKLLTNNSAYTKILVFNRRLQNYSSPKIKEILFNKQDIALIKEQLSATDLFCCIGTTIKKAGSKKAFSEVDYKIPTALAQIAENKKVNKMIVVSSVGANPNSNNFYLQTKGLMEQDIIKYAINKIHIVRPSILLGKRNEFRFGEEIGKIAIKLINPLIIGSAKKYKAVQAIHVAKAMIELAIGNYTQIFFNSYELKNLATKYDNKQK